MSVVNSTRTPRTRKPKKPKPPFKDFPLWAHPSGRWCRKVSGKVYYFGPWDNPQAALDEWEMDKADIIAKRERTSRRIKANLEPEEAKPTLRDLCNRFLTFKTSRVESGELKPHSFADYKRVCKAMIESFGADTLLTDIKPIHFERLRIKWAAKWGPVRLGNEINRAKVVFKYGYKNGLIVRDMQYGAGFDRPSQKTLELARNAKGKRMFEAEELREVIEAASQPMKAMILLGINCGFGNADVARMTMATLDLDGGWVDYAREKTGIMRRCWLWPETVREIQAWLEVRPTPKNAADAELVFLTAFRGSWYRDTADNPVSRVMRALLDKLSIKGNRNFYALRHGFETIGGDSRDQVAVDHVMGHRDPSQSAKYRERIGDDRLIAVAQHVRRWLFGAEAEGGAA